MEQISLNYFLSLGSALSRLSTVANSDYPLDDFRWTALNTATAWLRPVLDIDLGKMPFPESQLVAATVLAIIDDLVTARDSQAILDPVKSINLVHAIEKFWTAFETDSRNAYAYLISQIGAYETSTLVESADKHLSELTRARASTTTVTEFKLAGKCLCFNLFTASGFHAMRALEAEARKYHKIVTKADVELANATVGVLINGSHKKDGSVDIPGLRDVHEQEGKKNGSPLGLIISLLSQVNKIYRNPVMHPEQSLDHEGAKKVFELTALSIGFMTDDAVSRIEKKPLDPGMTEPEPPNDEQEYLI